MRAEPGLLAILLLLAATARADSDPAPSEDERAVLLATRGEAARKPGSALTAMAPAAAPDLDGAELQAWFDQHYGARPRSLAPEQASSIDEVADADAEASVLRAIERGRRP